MAFGQDEEISGPRGAANIAQFLLFIYGHHGIGMIVDEGGMGLETIYGRQFALPGIAEKGYLVSWHATHCKNKRGLIDSINPRTPCQL